MYISFDLPYLWSHSQIDKNTILLLSDKNLAEYLPARGDRLAILNHFGAKPSKKDNLFEKFKTKCT